jgi:dTDP-4-amino-4,6-dideoxygalactose transaminase
MDAILKVARKHKLLVIEDAAHGVKATYKGKELGSMGDFGALSFHETKNIISGEGGALLVNNPKFIKRAEIVWHKGTDRNQFVRGEVDKYTWRDIGSSFLPGELTAAFLWAQLEKADQITKMRLKIWNNYHKLLKELEDSGKLRRPIVPKNFRHNAHMYHIVVPSAKKCRETIEGLRKNKIKGVWHYQPLHASKFGKRYNQKNQPLKITNKLSQTIIRLPLYIGLKSKDISNVKKSLLASQKT